VKFFIYEKGTSLPGQRRSVYIDELLFCLKSSPHSCTNPNEADFFITELCSERNYPNYDMKGGPIPLKGNDLINHVRNLPYFHKNKKHITFYHDGSPSYDMEGILNIPYANPAFKEGRDFIMTPPALKNYSFNNNLNKKYLFSFKGDTRRTESRRRLFNSLKRFHNRENIIIVERDNGKYDYDELAMNSLFTIVPEGDQPWSYRFTESINAGSIPILLEENWHHLPFCDFVDYRKFAIRLPAAEAECIKETIFNLTLKKIYSSIEYMHEVNKLFFENRASHARALVAHLKLKG